MAAQQVTEGVYRLGTRWVNWYLVESGGVITVIDCGFSGYHDQLAPALAGIGRTVDDIEAIVLTHYHSDHVGSAERIRRESGAAVFAPERDAEGVRTGKVPVPKGFVRNAWRPKMIRYLGHAMTHGGAKVTPVSEVATYGDGQTLPVPGALRVIHTPGHTMGHCSLLAPGPGVLFAGDAIGTMSLVGGPDRPVVMPVNEDHGRTRESVSLLRGLEASFVCPGHGEPFAGSPAAAAEAALA